MPPGGRAACSEGLGPFLDRRRGSPSHFVGPVIQDQRQPGHLKVLQLPGTHLCQDTPSGWVLHQQVAEVGAGGGTMDERALPSSSHTAVHWPRMLFPPLLPGLAPPGPQLGSHLLAWPSLSSLSEAPGHLGTAHLGHLSGDWALIGRPSLTGEGLVSAGPPGPRTGAGTQ